MTSDATRFCLEPAVSSAAAYVMASKMHKIPETAEDLTLSWFQEVMADEELRDVLGQPCLKIADISLAPLSEQLGFMTTHLRGSMVRFPRGKPYTNQIADLHRRPQHPNLRQVGPQRAHVPRAHEPDSIRPQRSPFLRHAAAQTQDPDWTTSPHTRTSAGRRQTISPHPPRHVRRRLPGPPIRARLDFGHATGRCSTTLGDVGSRGVCHFDTIGVPDSVLEKYPFLVVDLGLDREKGMEMMKVQVHQNLNMVRALLNKAEADKHLLEIMEIVENNLEVLKLMAGGPASSGLNSLCQTDSWSNNYLLRKSDSPDQALLVDWQWPNYGLALRDLCSLMLTSTGAEMRREHTKLVIQEYCRAFEDTAKELGSSRRYPLADACADYGNCRLSVFIQMIFLVIAFTRSAEKQGSRITERYVEAMRELAEPGGPVHKYFSNIATESAKD